VQNCHVSRNDFSFDEKRKRKEMEIENVDVASTKNKLDSTCGLYYKLMG
jgi:hypothetical protein